MAGNYIFGKGVLNHGISRFVFIFYRNAIAAIVLAPFALIIERPVFNQNLTYLGMKYTSASFTSAIMNAAPSITFVLALLTGLEHVKIRQVRSQAKVIGTLLTFGGAVLMALYKGPGFNLFHSAATHNNGDVGPSSHDHHHSVGALYILLGCVGLSSFYILQSITIKEYQAELSLATWICMSGSLQTAIVAVIAERHSGSKAWAVGWDIRLYAPLYTGVVSSAIAYYIQGLVMNLKGPVFTTAFNPLCMVIVASLGSFFLRERLFLGSIIGSIIITIGLYSVLWGKANDNANKPKIQADEENTRPLPITTTAVDSTINQPSS
ncbi:hypothetical protein PIB30_015458 [Stylosanthes scabra]|uniref:WAT1-related protein n=1 Tax=Stylosanthes scabra TaxID=79078 RepID=A0ABU6V8R3_9FABA|nr:hypothetical protein [Stylosanthes scabra]